MTRGGGRKEGRTLTERGGKGAKENNVKRRPHKKNKEWKGKRKVRARLRLEA